MQRVLALVVVVGCYRSAEQPQEPIVLHPSGPGETVGTGAPLQVAADGPASAPLQVADDRPASARVASTSDLVLLGDDGVTFNAAGGVRVFDRICVQDRARITVDGSTRIELRSDRTTVIGGGGIGPRGATKSTIEIVAPGKPEIYVLFDNAAAPIHAVFDAPNSTVHVGITGKTGLELAGKTKTMASYGGWGLPPAFPNCDVNMDRDPEPSFSPSRVQAHNCVGNYTSSNYVTPRRGDRELHVVSVYEGRRHTDGVVEVRVPVRKRPVVLALTAYQPTIWRIDATTSIAAIYLYGYEQQRIEGVAPSVRVIRTTKPDFVCAYGWEPSANTGGCYYTKMIGAIRKATGLVESSFQGCYAGREFDVPVVPER